MIEKITVSRRDVHMLGAMGMSQLLLACAGTSDKPGKFNFQNPAAMLKVIAYANLKSLMDKLFQDYMSGHQGLAFTASYGASSDQSRKIVQGVPVDLTVLSLASDIYRLVNAGIVPRDWEKQYPHHSVPFGSVVAFVVRKNNPHNIRNWDDLLQKDVEVLTPDPRSSGSAKWNVLAPYLIYSHGGKHATEGIDYVKALIGDHTRLIPTSGRAASSIFVSGRADVLISYENEALLLDKIYPGRYEIIVPPQTLRIDNPVTVIPSSEQVTQAHKFVEYLFTDAVPVITQAGFRSTMSNPHAAHFAVPEKLWKIDQIGGWKVWDSLLFGSSGEITKIFAT